MAWFLVRALLLCACLESLANCLDQKLTAEEEEIELNSLFQSYNKPAVKEIKTIHGDTYKCVDFYKQPAFDHPLLKNHSYHQEMKIFPLAGQPSVLKESPLFSGLWVNGEGCPSGTVPIRKYTKDQYFRTRTSFQKLYPSDEPVPGRFRACVHTLNGPQTFYGGSAALNIYNYGFDNTQYTAGYMIVRAGNDQFQFGWTVNPYVYGDLNTRLFLTTKVEEKKCFNLMCGGFVLSNKNIPLDTVLTPTTQRGGKTAVDMIIIIVRDPTSKTWQLRTKGDLLIGYWPNEVLKGLSGPAEYLEWGGEAFNPPTNALSGPGMGSGFFPVGQPNQDGYAKRLTWYDETGANFTLLDRETETFSDNNDLYRVIDRGVVNIFYGHLALYGGPGKQFN